jgi:hypothetical protein
MSDLFPSVSTVSLKDAEPGSIVRISRHNKSKFALVTDHVVDGTRSFVWLNPDFPDMAPVIFAEKWRNDPSVLQYQTDIRFELGTTEDEIDPTGRRSGEMAGAIVSIGSDLFIRAAPEDQFYGRYILVNVRNGALYPDRLPDTMWTFLSWQLWIRDPLTRADLMLTEFRAIRKP